MLQAKYDDVTSKLELDLQLLKDNHREKVSGFEDVIVKLKQALADIAEQKKSLEAENEEITNQLHSSQVTMSTKSEVRIICF